MNQHDPPEDQPTPDEEIRAPFTFKLMIVLAVLYLGWRLVQGVMWIIDRVMN